MDFGRRGRRQPAELFNGSSPLLALVTVAVAVVVGGIVGAIGFDLVMSTPGPSGMVRDSIEKHVERGIASIDAPSRGSGTRLGQGELASSLDNCSDTLVDVLGMSRAEGTVDMQLAYLLMRRGNRPDGYVSNFGEFIECAIDRRPHDLCNPDNRALVVETLGRFLRFDDQVAAANDKGANEKMLRHFASQRERILLSTVAQARAGRLILSDFGRSPHADIRKIFESVGAAGDSCGS